jgi:hypothetical protein
VKTDANVLAAKLATTYASLLALVARRAFGPLVSRFAIWREIVLAGECVRCHFFSMLKP